MSGELVERVAVVTGAARNIGRAIALDLASAGASIVVNARSSAAEAAAVVEEIEAAGGKACVHLADIADPEAAQSLIDTAIRTFGRLDILVNNAAIRRETAFDDLGWQEWREVLSVILDGAYLCAHAAVVHLRQSDAGSIVNIGGMSAHSGAADRAHVIAAKAGLVGLTRGLAHDLAPQVTVNCVVPGLIDTVRIAATGMPGHDRGRSTLLGRRGRPEDVASLVRYLCGPGGRYVTGQAIHANGGTFMS